MGPTLPIEYLFLLREKKKERKRYLFESTPENVRESLTKKTK